MRRRWTPSGRARRRRAHRFRLASCAAVSMTDGTYLAIENLIEFQNGEPNIISVSYGWCETSMGEALNTAFQNMFQMADAEGISVFVATGDYGPSDCASSKSVPAQSGIGANGWATTTYNVAVGGTAFSDLLDGSAATYWNSSNSAAWGSAKSYIPEIPWNDTCASALIAGYYGFQGYNGRLAFCRLRQCRVGQSRLRGGRGRSQRVRDRSAFNSLCRKAAPARAERFRIGNPILPALTCPLPPAASEPSRTCLSMPTGAAPHSLTITLSASLTH